MSDALVVFLKTGVMGLLLAVGWWANRRGVLDSGMARGLGILVVEITFPALVFVQMLRTVSPQALVQGWWIPVLGLLTIPISALVGRFMAGRITLAPASRKTFIFLVAVPNWVYLPLPIAESLYGAAGVRFVLLFNLGAQIAIWTLAPVLLQGNRTGIKLKTVVSNRGILATLLGMAIALLWPASASLGLDLKAPTGLLSMAGTGIVNALEMIGSLTIPLTLLVTGGQLAAEGGAWPFKVVPVAGVLVGRLVLAPLAMLVPIRLIAGLSGWRITEVELVTAAIIVAMPPAVSCSMFVERFGGDRELSSRGIVIATLAGLVTVPLAVFFCRIGGGW